MTDELKECRDLLPCPFCGGEPQELHRVATRGTVYCLKCSAYTISTSDWNTRTKAKGEFVSDILDVDFPDIVFLCAPHLKQSINGHKQIVGLFVTNKPDGKHQPYMKNTTLAAKDALIAELVEALQAMHFYIAASYEELQAKSITRSQALKNAYILHDKTLYTAAKMGYGKE